jgi:hypothetical protein
MVLLDTSGSMQTQDAPGGCRFRCAADRWLSAERRKAFAEHYEVRLLGFDSSLRPLAPSRLGEPADRLAAGRASRIAHCVTEALTGSGAKDAAMLVLSDGRDTDSTGVHDAAMLARARDVPIFTACFGGPTQQRDVQLVALARQEFLLAGEPGHVVARVYQVGMPQATTTLHLTGPGAEVTRPVRFDGKSSVIVELPVKQPKAGLYDYTVRVEPVAGERETTNNAQRVFVRVTEQRIRVLLLEGEPFWDTKFLAQSLRKDGRIELTQISRISLRKQETILTRAGTGTKLPRTADALAAYDVVVLGRGLEHVLDPPAAGLLVDYVSRRGGQVIFARGRAYDPATPAGRQIGRALAVIEPVIWARGVTRNLSLSLTPVGRANPCFSFAGMALDAGEAVGKLPGFTLMSLVQREKTAAQVLARAAPPGQVRASGRGVGEPAVVAMNYGRGRVVAVLGEGLWRWSFLPPEMQALDGVYDTFWSNMVRWLATAGSFPPGASVSLRLSRSGVQRGDPLLIDVACKFDPAAAGTLKLTVTDPDGRPRPLPLPARPGAGGRLSAEYVAQDVGVYAVRLEAPGMTPPRVEDRFSVYDVDFERLNTSADPATLAALAEQSDGKVLPADRPDALAAELTRRREARVGPRRPQFTWDRWFFLVILLGWIGGEWLVRRRAGLL